MKRISTIGFALLLIFGITSCGNSQGNDSSGEQENNNSIAKNIGVAEFQKKMTSDVIILDVRTPEEVAAGAIEGSIAMDLYNADFKQSLEKMDKSKPVLVYCAVGGRSGHVMNTMKKMGFNEVYNLSGGIRAWVSEGKPVK